MLMAYVCGALNFRAVYLASVAYKFTTHRIPSGFIRSTLPISDGSGQKKTGT